MTFARMKKGGLIAAAIASLLAGPAFAKVTVLGWPGGPEETALRAANNKFQRRFHFIEEKLKERGRSLEQASLDEMEAIWLEAKKAGL